MTTMMSQDEARAAFTAARAVRLATVDADGRPHLVPITFVVDGECVYFAVDAKPKRSPRLRRLRNIAENPQVCLLADEYSEDWEQLWWVRADGAARAWPPEDGPADETEHETEYGAGDMRRHVAELLRAKYPQYADLADPAEGSGFGPIVEIRVSRWSGWRWH
jgi:PPOX class probable F420-dependent enzyme